MELPTVARVSVGSTTRKVAPAKIGKAKFTSNGIRNGTVAGTRNKSVTLGHHANRTVAVAAGDVDASQGQQDSKQVQKWGFVVANAKFLLDEEEHLAEVLRERRRYFQEKEKDMDFFIVPEPKWLDEKFPDVAKRTKRPAAAIVSTDLVWITFVKLRVDRCYKGEVECSKEDILASAGSVGEFEDPELWTAPYNKYDGDWWKVFLPQEA